jgi:hypothetical protein
MQPTQVIIPDEDPIEALAQQQDVALPQLDLPAQKCHHIHADCQESTGQIYITPPAVSSNHQYLATPPS